MVKDPTWEIGKHDWRDGGNCMICGLVRKFDLFSEEESVLYEVNGTLVPVPTPCTPRLRTRVQGLLTTKEAHAHLGIRYDDFLRRTHRRRIYPAAVTVKNNVYLWREDQLIAIASEEED